jgi:hypothetical protein
LTSSSIALQVNQERHSIEISKTTQFNIPKSNTKLSQQITKQYLDPKKSKKAKLMLPFQSGDEQNEFFYWNQVASFSMQLASPHPKIPHKNKIIKFKNKKCCPVKIQSEIYIFTITIPSLHLMPITVLQNKNNFKKIKIVKQKVIETDLGL